MGFAAGWMMTPIRTCPGPLKGMSPTNVTLTRIKNFLKCNQVKDFERHSLVLSRWVANPIHDKCLPKQTVWESRMGLEECTKTDTDIRHPQARSIFQPGVSPLESLGEPEPWWPCDFRCSFRPPSLRKICSNECREVIGTKEQKQWDSVPRQRMNSSRAMQGYEEWMGEWEQAGVQFGWISTRGRSCSVRCPQRPVPRLTCCSRGTGATQMNAHK